MDRASTSSRDAIESREIPSPLDRPNFDIWYASDAIGYTPWPKTGSHEEEESDREQGEENHSRVERLRFTDRAYSEEEERHPHMMAVGLSGQDEHLYKVGKVKRSREEPSHSRAPIDSEEEPFTFDAILGGKCCEIQYANEDTRYIQWLMGHARDEAEAQSKSHEHADQHHHKSHSRKEADHRNKGQSSFADNLVSLEPRENPHGVILKMSYECFLAGKKVEHEMIDKIFHHPDFADWKGMLVQHWLPQIPDSLKRNYKSFTKESFLKECFFLVQHYVYGLEAMVNDQKAAKGPFFKQFNKLMEDCARLHAEYKKSFKKLKITDYSHIKSGVMPNEYRDLKLDVSRHLRDYLILSEYVKAMSYICRGMCYLRYTNLFP